MHTRPPTSTLFPYTTLFRSAMPETCFPIRTKLQVPISSPALALLWISVTLGGCSGGDFGRTRQDRKSTRLNSSHVSISYAVFCLKKKRNLSNLTSCVIPILL